MSETEEHPVQQAIDWGANWDWISPAVEWAGSLAGMTSTILVPAACGYSGYEIALYLMENGVMVYGIYVVSETFMLSVAENQVEYARRLLAAVGMLGE